VRRKSIYTPGGTCHSLPAAGASTARTVLAVSLVKESSTTRWLPSQEWVTAPGATSTTLAIFAGSPA